MKIIGISGPSGSGKTTLCEQLIPWLREQGLRVTSLKHSHHDVDLDQPGKDSFRHRQAGSQEVLLVGPRRWVLQHEWQAAPSLDQLLPQIAPCDVLLVEGWREATLAGQALPRLLIHRQGNGKPFDASYAPGAFAVASDAVNLATSLPLFGLNDIAAISACLLMQPDAAVKAQP